MSSSHQNPRILPNENEILQTQPQKPELSAKQKEQMEGMQKWERIRQQRREAAEIQDDGKNFKDWAWFELTSE